MNSNSNSNSTETAIIEVLKTLLEQGANGLYKVITAFDASEEKGLNGVVAVQITNVENLNHGAEHDYKYTANISGQTLADEDRDKSKIQAINQSVLSIIGNTANIELPNLAGALFRGGTIEDDGDTRNFSYEMEFFVCDAI